MEMKPSKAKLTKVGFLNLFIPSAISGYSLLPMDALPSWVTVYF